MANKNSGLEEWSDSLDLATLHYDLVSEIAHAAQSCLALQWSISALLEKVDHPDLAAEIHMLQDVDRLQQTLVDIAAILNVSATACSGLPVSRPEIGSAIRLESLRRRLGLSHEAGDGISEPVPDPDGDITWL